MKFQNAGLKMNKRFSFQAADNVFCSFNTLCSDNGQKRVFGMQFLKSAFGCKLTRVVSHEHDCEEPLSGYANEKSHFTYYCLILIYLFFTPYDSRN